MKLTTEPVWEPITIAKALSLCDFDALYVAMNLAFACSLRIGEILGLTWDDIHFAENGGDTSWLQVSKTLLEVNKQAAAATEGRDILMVFPSAKSNSSMSLILKKPKTKHSIRKVYLPRTTADILKEWHIRQLELIDLLGADYQNYNLVLAQNSGKPYDSHQIYKLLKTFIHAHHLPDVTFHSLRHPYVKHTTKIFSLRLMDSQAQAYPDARRKTRGACQLHRGGQNRSSVRPLCNRKRFS